MKPGDKVWVFDAGHQKIVSIKVIQGGEYVVAAGKSMVLFRPGFDCFPTREALCEHYRKIFE